MKDWLWWSLAVVLIVAEIITPGTYLLWPGLAAALVGLMVWLLPGLSWQVQGLLFSALSVAAIFGWREWQMRHPVASDQATLNRRGEQYLGRNIMLSEPIVNGRGRTRIDDSVWTVQGEDSPRGTAVQVVGVDGTILKVKRTILVVERE